MYMKLSLEAHVMTGFPSRSKLTPSFQRPRGEGKMAVGPWQVADDVAASAGAACHSTSAAHLSFQESFKTALR